MTEWLFAPAFTLWGSPTTWLEIAAFGLALGMVACNIRTVIWGWPLAMASSLLYGALFWRSKLYGEAALQVFFVLLAGWGWRQWLRGQRHAYGSLPQVPPQTLRIARLPAANITKLIAASAVFILATGLFLSKFTDSDVPWADAVPTALSVVGTWLLGRKYLENWLVWGVVNSISVGLFAYKGLWLTAALYALLLVLSWVGWRAWQRQL
ncbi:MAG: nicotinamide riboside transporter PnuC [Burkholderiaceae bacterium]